jgi:mono/diheme cytochrome c family protein
MTEMYYSEAYEPYSNPLRPFGKKKNFFFKKGITALMPVNGSIPLTDNQILTYTLPNSKKGYNASLKITESPLGHFDIERGKSMYKINCAICHGDIGNGQGELVKNEKILGVPNYKERKITLGSVFHVMKYGKNNMGIYGSELTQEDLWKISEYVIHLQKR